MKVPLHIVLARRDKLAHLIAQHGYLPVSELCQRLGVSEATARRDLAALERDQRVTRTFGGALSDFNQRFPSFRQRHEESREGKAAVGQAALAFLRPGATCYFDSGTTIHAVAEALRDHPISPLTVVTGNLPVAEMLAATESVEVFMLAGKLLHRQSVLLGEIAQRSVEFWRFDLAFLSAESMRAEGIFNSREEIVALQKAVLARSAQSIFCLDAAKLGHDDAPHFLAGWNEVDILLTDAPYADLRRRRIDLPRERFVHVSDKRARKPPGQKLGADDENLPVHIL